MKRCPLCTSIVQRLRPHVRSQHGDKLTEVQVKIVANIGNIRGRTAHRGRLYKICPVDGCGAVTRLMTTHLRNQHGLDGDGIRFLRNYAQPVDRYEMPDVPMAQEGRPEPAEVAGRAEVHDAVLAVPDADGRPRLSTEPDGSAGSGLPATRVSTQVAHTT